MPLSDCEVRDPRMRRTRQLLQGALDNLMQTKSFDEITVQDIAEAATVNRATFYDHYTDKYALLEAKVAGGFHRLLQERKVGYDCSCPSAASALILATCDYLTRNDASTSACKRQSAFLPLVESAIVAAIRRVLIGGMPKVEPVAGPATDMIATTASWAIYGAAKEWFASPNRRPAEEIVPIVLRLVMPILRASEPVQSQDSEIARAHEPLAVRPE